jgi:hypothetical protein
MGSERPAIIRIAQLVGIPVGTLVFLVLGILLLSTGRKGSAWLAFGMAAAGPISIGLYHLVARVARRRVTQGTISLPIAPETALQWVTEALRTLEDQGSVAVDVEEYSASIDVTRSWKSFGERVVATVYRDGEESLVEVSSKNTPSQLVDYGKNRQNVERVIRELNIRRFNHGSN